MNVQKLIVILLAVLTNSMLKSQNLVPNPGFDTLTLCPDVEGTVRLAVPWEGIRTPDLYNECSAHPFYAVPYNHFCNYLPPKTGGGYAGMYVYNTHEFVEAPLLDTLEAGKPYYARFYAAPKDPCGAGDVAIFIDALSMSVSPDIRNSNYYVAMSNQSGVIRDTANWTRVAGCFTAKGGEKWLRVGNALANSETTVESDPPTPLNQLFPYVFIDDIWLSAFDPLPDTLLLCNGLPLTLDATFPDAAFRWSNGAETPVIQVSDTGRVAVQALLDGCILTDQVVIVAENHLPPMPPDTTLCEGQALMLSPGIQGVYRWNDGSRAAGRVVTTSGLYSASIENNCGIFTFSRRANFDDCRCQVYVPNAFSPNDDGVNDRLDVFMNCRTTIAQVNFKVFNRWGGVVFSFAGNNTLAARWNGEVNGLKADPGAYVWQLTYEMPDVQGNRMITEKGEVLLIR